MQIRACVEPLSKLPGVRYRSGSATPCSRTTCWASGRAGAGDAADVRVGTGVGTGGSCIVSGEGVALTSAATVTLVGGLAGRALPSAPIRKKAPNPVVIL